MKPSLGYKVELYYKNGAYEGTCKEVDRVETNEREMRQIYIFCGCFFLVFCILNTFCEPDSPGVATDDWT